jgi:hypothetical protein
LVKDLKIQFGSLLKESHGRDYVPLEERDNWYAEGGSGTFFNKCFRDLKVADDVDVTVKDDTLHSVRISKGNQEYALSDGSIGAVHYAFRKKFIALSFDHERAEQSGMRVRAWDFLFYALFGLIVTSFVQVGGVLMVFSYLIVPAACGVYLARSLPAQLLIGWLAATLASVGGLYASFQLDVPTGAAIVCALGVVLLGTALWAGLRRRTAG